MLFTTLPTHLQIFSPQTQTWILKSSLTRTTRSMNKQVVGVHDASKQIRKTKKKAEVKVVYISNPMKVNTSVSQFRALVQQLTGRNADDMPEEPFLEHSNVENEEQEQVVSEEVQKVDAQVAVSCVENEDNFNGSSDLLSLQDITGYFSPSNFWYESAFHVDGSKV